MAKTVLTKEQLDLLLSTYNQVGTYAAAGRAVGISSPVATRIIKEYKEAHPDDVDESVEPISYNGPAPKSQPDFNDVHYCFWNAEGWMD